MKGHHITPRKTLLKVFVALVALTALTALTAQIDIGAFNIPLALAIAGTKALLVVLFFMALKYDKPVNALFFGLGILFVVVFLTFTLFDTAFRGDLGNVGEEAILNTEGTEQGE
ncbi:MAG: oxidase [Bacteroidetes bacterium SB0662_bin_6]|nr:oxidase [Bacteroidetes bacterium SB0668_bin_1]MYE05138.1 oxidase [Bacteroidetes bacterium SB0662_bin_6]